MKLRREQEISAEDIEVVKLWFNGQISGMDAAQRTSTFFTSAFHQLALKAVKESLRTGLLEWRE